LVLGTGNRVRLPEKNKVEKVETIFRTKGGRERGGGVPAHIQWRSNETRVSRDLLEGSARSDRPRIQTHRSGNDVIVAGGGEILSERGYRGFSNW